MGRLEDEFREKDLVLTFVDLGFRVNIPIDCSRMKGYLPGSGTSYKQFVINVGNAVCAAYRR